MRIDVLSLFPELFEPILGNSMPGRAKACGAVEYYLHHLRDWTTDKHRSVDDRPFGGGPGMVLMCEPMWNAVNAIDAECSTPARRVLLSPQGKRLDQRLVENLAAEERLLLVAGHYEGVDERAIDALKLEEISIGDYVLSGGEIPAMVLIDAVTRLLPGVLGNDQSAAEDSFTHRSLEGEPLLDCPHYTRPREWRGTSVPDVLLSGDHSAVARWRHEQSVTRTRRRRPDLLNQPQPLGDPARPMSRQPNGAPTCTEGEQLGDGPGDSQA